eukprot:CAMPEP_0114988930 /NCGR_PEP_ID=MMETSP0216-20121206/9897_1 /TAXON_ID=223996 /ORGANISM="Protocruzia adherens, Strain Boccale" /LENGTH=607 /DNA_ID=CAMNT_0002351815 /DNA_START=171 /DNA_END=1994 /DNA_ORIENTATION=-
MASKQIQVQAPKSLSLSWDVEEYTIQVKNTHRTPENPDKRVPKTVLSKVKGGAVTGDFVAIMGPSGAGKTTLLSLLSDRIEPSKGTTLNKNVSLNGNELTARNFGKTAAYVMQDDRLFATLTPRECIQFVVNMRLNASSYEKRRKVDDILAELGLLKCADTIVGNAKMKGISGGERKRVSIAVELVTDPDVVFLDEPTSGLDTVTAFRICKTLKRLSNQGKIVICTIHQPTAEAFFLFNKLILLAKGRLMYQGLTKNSVEYFNDAGYKCPEFLNPIEYFMKIVQPRGDSQEVSKQFNKLAEVYERTSALPASNDEPIRVNVKYPNQVANGDAPPAKVSGLTKMYYLTKRAVHNVKRNRPLIATRTGSTIIFGLLLLLVWFGKGDSKTDVKDKMGLFLFVGINQFMMSVQSVLLSFPQERDVFLKEYSGRLYGVVPYFLAKNIPEIPFQIIFPTLFSIIGYHGCGLRDSGEHFLWFILIVLLTSLSGISFGFMISCVINDVEVANSVGIMSLFPFLLTGGFFANVEDLGPWIAWVQYISPLRYSLEALARNEFEDRTVCTEQPQGCDPIEEYSLDFGFATSIIVLLVMSLGYRLLALVALKLKAKTIG